MAVMIIAVSASYALGWWLWSANTLEDPLHRLTKRPSSIQSMEDEERLKRRVDELWTRIENQLKVISQEEYDFLAPGCSHEALEELEDQLGFKLPVEARESLLRHNGVLDTSGRNMAAGGMFHLYSIAEIRKYYRDQVETWCWVGQRNWVENSGNWPTIIPLAVSIDFHFNVECRTGKIYMGRSGYDNADLIAEDWTKVLESWAVALEEKKFVMGNEGMYIENWAGLNPY
jgi:cell wall assembly regulator SMI1